MFLAEKSLWSYVGLYQKFLYKSFSLLITPPPPQSLFSHLPWCNDGCIWDKEHNVLYSSTSCTRLQWSVRISQTRYRHSNWKISVCHINPKWHAADFHMKLFFSLPWPFPGIPSIVPRGSRLSRRRVQLKASFTKRLPLLHQRYRIRPPHHLTQGTLLNLVFSTPPIGQKILPFSGIRFWRSMMTWNHTPIMLLWFTLLLLTHCLRYCSIPCTLEIT